MLVGANDADSRFRLECSVEGAQAVSTVLLQLLEAGGATQLSSIGSWVALLQVHERLCSPSLASDHPLPLTPPAVFPNLTSPFNLLSIQYPQTPSVPVLAKLHTLHPPQVSLISMAPSFPQLVCVTASHENEAAADRGVEALKLLALDASSFPLSLVPTHLETKLETRLFRRLRTGQ